jgi:predicted dinucleotide-binding enzyme
MKVGILGSGDVAKSLARAFLTTGHSVKLGTRSPAKLRAFLKEAGAKASAGSLAQAAGFGEVVVLAVRGAAAEQAVKAAGASKLAGKVLIDVTNPLKFGPGAVPSLFVGHTDSLGERVQRAASAARVVKAFNIVGNPYFFKPDFPGGPPDMFICGEDADAKERVTAILTSFGWPVVDIGGISGARALESLCMLWVKSAFAIGTWKIAFKLLRK